MQKNQKIKAAPASLLTPCIPLESRKLALRAQTTELPDAAFRSFALRSSASDSNFYTIYYNIYAEPGKYSPLFFWISLRDTYLCRNSKRNQGILLEGHTELKHLRYYS